ncbi:MAG: exonuclease SbcCD subunit D [Anaeroplasma bactoclasticum]|nr:exonuclease SbcCD subunit D [Anaeroplasma bactoclasticum]
MKLLHTADLHLGKRFMDISLLEDQMDVLRQIVQLAKTNQVDGLLIAGDVYDKSVPSSEAMCAFNWFLEELSALNISVFVIAGNHDSDERIAYLSHFVAQSHIYVSTKFSGTLQTIMMQDEYGPLAIHLLPFIKPIHVKKIYPEAEITTYEEAIQCVIAHSKIDYSIRNILVAHQFITGGITSESEEISIGGLDHIQASVFDDFDYVALGHLHQAQRIQRDTLRYAGSIMKYAISEEYHRPSITQIECKEKGNITYQLIPLTCLHQVRTVRGTLTDILNMDYSEDYVRVILTDEEVMPDARISALTVFPNMVQYAIQNSKTEETMDIVITEQIENKSISDLFCDFYQLQNNQVLPSDDHLSLLEEVLEKIKEES